MRYQTSDKLIAWLTLFSGLTISAVAIYYSVAGLVAIFAAAVIPIIVMGVALEVSKLAATVWLKQNWNRAPAFIRAYLLAAIVILMLITSMGIFGFLSKAHSDQSLVSGDVQSKIALYDEKIKIERENIANAQSVIKQMDSAVTGVISTGDQEFKRNDGTTGVRSAAERSLQIRRSQANDRAILIKQIDQSQSKIIALQEEAAPIRAEIRKVEAEVGPIKYIASFIYGSNPDTNLLEKAVTWVIIIIVIVFDPLAVILLLASQYSFQWFRKEKEEIDEEQILPAASPANDDDLVKEANAKIDEIEKTQVETDLQDWEENTSPPYKVIDDADEETVEQFDLLAHARSHTPPKDEQLEIVEEIGVEQWNKMIEEAERELENEKEAKRIWKEQHPDDTLKHQERLKDAGIIEQLPWENDLDRPGDYLSEVTGDRYKPDLTEVIEPVGSKKKTTYVMKEQNHQVTKTKE
jgi:hypothetical protein